MASFLKMKFGERFLSIRRERWETKVEGTVEGRR